MLLILSIIFFVAWLLGVAGAYAIGAFVHLLLIAAIALFVAALLNRAIARS